jgi:leucyl-tRNA synthetase
MNKPKTLEVNKIESKWQKEWERAGIYSPEIEHAQNPFFNLWMFPYPSAEGLHAGHAFSSTGSDIYGRYQRMNGKDVFQPIGYDSFGIHSENYAIKIGEQPQTVIERTTKHYESQLRKLGHGYDWTRTVTTSDEDYYKWTQWLFITLFKAGLARRAKSKVNWCPSCMTVLADEQVIEGKCERCGTNVEKKDLEQWFVRITDYAEKLLSNLDTIDWPERIKLSQKNWIGKSEGAKIVFKIKGQDETSLEVFTTRPDTLNGATFVVISPDSSWVERLVTKDESINVSEYISSIQNKSPEDHSKEKSGVFTGSYAINPLNGKEIPVWIANYVVSTYGSGVVMGVPAHDERDKEFAKAYKIEIAQLKPDKSIWESLEKEGWGAKYTNFHLRDWLISRQRYWGPPIPMIFCKDCAEKGVSYFTENKGSVRSDQKDWDHAGWWPVEEDKLPVKLPFIADYKPSGDGQGPLSSHPEFYNVSCPHCGKEAKRETDVSDTFLDSSWYFLRYPSVRAVDNSEMPFNKEITKMWLPVSFYFGGAEHAVLHLMYSRFVALVLTELKIVEFGEPFPRFFAHGLMIKDGAKMSKSRGNVVNPDEYVEKFGADALRLYLMFMGPIDGYPDFRDTGIEGMKRFVDRVYRLLSEKKEFKINDEETKIITTKLHQTVKKVTEDIEHFRYNTAISSLMELINVIEEKRTENDIEKDNEFIKDIKIKLTLLLAPFAPHLAEEIWVDELGKEFSVHTSLWPKYDEALTLEENVIIPIQVNGKLRGQIEIDINKAKDQSLIEEMAKNDAKVNVWIQKGSINKIIFVPGKLINFVIV